MHSSSLLGCKSPQMVVVPRTYSTGQVSREHSSGSCFSSVVKGAAVRRCGGAAAYSLLALSVLSPSFGQTQALLCEDVSHSVSVATSLNNADDTFSVLTLPRGDRRVGCGPVAPLVVTVDGLEARMMSSRQLLYEDSCVRDCTESVGVPEIRHETTQRQTPPGALISICCNVAVVSEFSYDAQSLERFRLNVAVEKSLEPLDPRFATTNTCILPESSTELAAVASSPTSDQFVIANAASECNQAEWFGTQYSSCTTLYGIATTSRSDEILYLSFPDVSGPTCGLFVLSSSVRAATLTFTGNYGSTENPCLPITVHSLRTGNTTQFLVPAVGRDRESCNLPL